MTAHAKRWGHAHDAVTAAQALDGDRAAGLDAYLEAFATTPSALAAVLLALSAAADTAERADTLTCMWSEFMDRFAEQRDRELSVALLPARWNPLPGAADRPRRSLAAGRSGTLPARCWPII
ncbi:MULTISPECIES: hypothetical protein [Streptomyces]|uniref:hypothetical protein n=1 Tax=Streptomyces TaxID=1883 RepID=UPI000BF0B3F4|nr:MULTISPECIES: hypothetical protein [unclassified Streptomyces]WTE31005.1 hypothetical protein OHB50_37700 [Streptomyces anulatus]